MAKRRPPFDVLTRVLTRLTPGERKKFRALAARPMAAIAYIQAKGQWAEGYSDVELVALTREILETMRPFLRFLAKHGIDVVPTTQKRTRRGRTAKRKKQ